MPRHELTRGPECPPLETLLSAHDEQAKSHLAGCPACRAELELFRTFEQPDAGNAEQADLAWIAARLQEARPGLPPKRWWLRFIGAPRLALAAVSLLLLVAVAVQWNSRRVTPLDQGGAAADNLRSSGSLEWIEAPAGEIAAGRIPRRLRWTTVPRASYYAELLEVDGTVAWKSGITTGDSLELPEEAVRLLEPRRRFALRVSALSPAGKVQAVTPDASFRILPAGAEPAR